ncbi:hypothetical protein MnTg02_01460 [bacterium MnTg02]|nr:hypothetical protein MnTg02_01460 [bacterium MnTg02]
MGKLHRMAAVCACLTGLISLSAHAVPVSGQGTWETTLLARDFDGDTNTIEGYYDTVLGITWLAYTSSAGTFNWEDANAWAAGLVVNDITNWRLPIVDSGSGCNTGYGGTNCGYNVLTTDGTTVYSEMASMFYDTLANKGQFASLEDDIAGIFQTGWGLSNTGPFDNLMSAGYWPGTSISDVLARDFYFSSGNQGVTGKTSNLYAWAVHDGDVGMAVVPLPAALPLFGTGLGIMGFIGWRRKRRMAAEAA